MKITNYSHKFHGSSFPYRSSRDRVSVMLNYFVISLNFDKDCVTLG